MLHVHMLHVHVLLLVIGTSVEREEGRRAMSAGTFLFCWSSLLMVAVLGFVKLHWNLIIEVAMAMADAKF